ncbi:MAG: PDZ domain-containing protein [Desulfosarcina sp.]|nr:PDZ domain-containing protein [Desulfosarcina sp.]MBC2741505.1 PDZ domain-containing protein [Desulfosarcina sp.]MBC2764419.1 PDZ domain-containing protein [Desulfosarcina sp.]
MIPKAIFTFVNLICITVSAYVVVDGFYGTITARLAQKPLPAQQNAYRVGNTDTARRPLSAYKAVLERNLFNTRSASEPQAQKVDVESLEETKLNLKLWGTVSGSNDGDYAVIEDVKAREQNLYRTGDAIQTATVKEIYREKVVLTVNGKDEVLQMQELKSGKAGSRPGGLPVRAEAPSTGAVRAQRISLRRSYIEQSMTDMASLMTQVQIRPHIENGVPAGMALSSIKPNSIFRRMGLRNGDIITGVDGSEISSVDDALKLVDNLQSSSNLSVQLKRRGREKNIEYSIR